MFLQSLFAKPVFQYGERVNQIQRGAITRTDGYVVAQTANGVMVEWPRGGSSWVQASELSAISV